MEKFSVAMCVYGKDNSIWFDRAIKSVTVDQTVKPNELVLVVDGPIPNDIENVIIKYNEILSNNNINLKVVRFQENQGHGNARRASIANSSYNLIALMDADDISVKDRFEKQLIAFTSDYDVCGGNISEFIDDESNIVSYRIVPNNDSEIKKYAKSRCPMNQMTVMFKKEMYDKSGGYIDWYQDEDYYLWLRMIKNGAKFYNNGIVMVNVRVGKDMYMRRGGYKYYKSEKKLQKYMLNEKFISYPRYIMNCFKRFIVQVLMPNKLRGFIFKKFARSRK